MKWQLVTLKISLTFCIKCLKTGFKKILTSSLKLTFNLLHVLPL